VLNPNEARPQDGSIPASFEVETQRGQAHLPNLKMFRAQELSRIFSGWEGELAPAAPSLLSQPASHPQCDTQETVTPSVVPFEHPSYPHNRTNEQAGRRVRLAHNRGWSCLFVRKTFVRK
jgi:hypothetical protein